MKMECRQIGGGVNKSNTELERGFSIFTPAYNRGHLLSHVKECLERQTFRDFEWIIIDDGSTDNTENVVTEFLKATSFPIMYIKQENAGKHMAQNRALELATKVLFLPLDSDDTIVDDCLEIMWNAWSSIPENERQFYSGVGVHCMRSDGRQIGLNWPKDNMISNDLEMKFIYKISGEKWGCIRTDIMREFPNMAVKGNFLSEDTVWFRIAKKYKKLYINKAVRFYEIGADSVQMRSYKRDVHNAEARITAGLIFINEFYDWYRRYKPKELIRMPLSMSKLSLLINKPVFFGKDALIHKIHPMLVKLVLIAGYPLVFVIQTRYIRKNKK